MTAAQLGLAIDDAAHAADAPEPQPGRTISFTIPGAPVAKGRPRTAVVNGRALVYTPSATRREEGAIRLIAAAAMDGAEPLIGPLRIEVASYLPIPQSWSGVKQRRARAGDIMPTGRPDLDNLGKLGIDAMLGIVFRDDSQIVSAFFSKRYSAEPRTEVTVTMLQAERA